MSAASSKRSYNKERGKVQGPLILDRYRPIEIKGEGGSGRVELCWDTRIMRRVAIKRMPICGADSSGSIPGLAEARTGAMLSRPSIVSVYDFDATDTEAFLIMEAIEGPTLSEIIADTPKGTFDLDVIASILAAVGDAVSFAHENQVLHLDIKPDNILITRSGSCKVSDFGIAELADAQGYGEASGGTLGYMPLEQMQRKELDERCDEFALAMVTYEMLTGLTPFSASTIDESIKLIKKFDVAPPSEVRGDLEPGIDSVLFAALAPEREERYETVDDFMVALMPYLGNPAQGLRRLREIAADDDEETNSVDEDAPYLDVLQRVPTRVGNIAGRVACATLSWWIAALGFMGIGAIPREIALVVALLPALAGAVKPPLGAFLSLAILGVSICLSPVLSTVLGIALIAASVAWLFSARQGSAADANCALLAAPLGLIGITPVAPLVAGYCLPPKRAVTASLMQIAVAITLSSATGSASLLHFEPFLSQGANTEAILLHSITNPATWIIIVAWVLSAVFMSLFCSHETRLLSVVGTCVASCVLVFADVIAAWLVSGVWALPTTNWTTAVMFALVVMCVVSILGVPSRHKGEE